MDQITRSKNAIAMIFRNAPARLREQLMKRSRVQAPEEQRAGKLKRPRPATGPLRTPPVPQTPRRKQ